MTKNCGKFRKIMADYRAGKYGNDDMRLSDILESAGEPDLLEKMNEQELRSLKDILGNMALSFALAALKERLSQTSKNLKLYKITLKGMTYSATGMVHGVAYVVATGMDEAYLKLKSHLDEKDIGFSKDRALEKIELLAENCAYPNTDYKLYL